MTDQELQQLVTSNARIVQAMLEQQKDSKSVDKEQTSEMRDVILTLARIEEKLANMISSHR
jgi:two-component sensor histidine kinase